MRLRRRAVHVGTALIGAIGLILGTSAVSAAAESSHELHDHESHDHGHGPNGAVTVSTVASGFDNPRGLAFGEEGQLYVAEAGKGGPACVPGGPEGPICPGLTGAISVITPSGSHHRIVNGLASLSGEGGVFATGPDGLSFNDESGLYTVITSCPQQVGGLPAGSFPPSLVSALKTQAGQVVKLNSDGSFTPTAGVGAFDWDWSLTHTNLVPGQFPDCNPYAILADEHTQWVIDAATNTLDRVTSHGIEIVAFFPNPPVSDAVPTCVDRGPDGALYVGELTGGGNEPGASVVWRVDTRREHPVPEMWASGLTAVTGCSFVDGTFYATEFSTLGLDNAAPGTGAVVRVPPHSAKPIPLVSNLNFPNGFAERGDDIYVSNWSIAPAVLPAGAPFKPGEVVKISFPEEHEHHSDHGHDEHHGHDNDD